MNLDAPTVLGLIGALGGVTGAMALLKAYFVTPVLLRVIELRVAALETREVARDAQRQVDRELLVRINTQLEDLRKHFERIFPLIPIIK